MSKIIFIKFIFIFILSILFADSVTLDELLPKLSPQYDYFGDGQQPIYRQQAGNFGNSFGGGNNFLNNGDNTVNFDFLCKCQAKSSLIKSSTPSSGDLSTQQQVQQLQEQVKKLQEQINKSQQGKSSFEQFAQMLSLADGLDCNCSGHSTPWTGWPSSSLINGGNNVEMPNINPYNIPHQIIPPTNNNRVINPLSIAGNGQFIPMGGFRPSMGGWNGGVQQPHQQQFVSSNQLFPYPQTFMSENLKKRAV
uniref:Candidate secreted effector n=2 Tax=Meloidogyne TaxID=189290 RepID=A0A914N3K0_MELIC